MIRTNDHQQNDRHDEDIDHLKHDEDIDHLKALIAQLIKQNSKRQACERHAIDSQKYDTLQQENQYLKQKIESLTNQNKRIIQELLAQREENSRLKNQIQNSDTNNRLSFEKSERITKTQAHPIEQSPSRHFHENQLVRPQQSSPSRLVTLGSNSSIDRDQLYRLNSNLIQYNTNIRLLIEKYNYLHKLRGLNFGNDAEQLKVINQANQIFSNRRSIEQAQSILQSSRKKYFGSDSSSDIEQELNQIQQCT